MPALEDVPVAMTSSGSRTEDIVSMRAGISKMRPRLLADCSPHSRSVPGRSYPNRARRLLQSAVPLDWRLSVESVLHMALRCTVAKPSVDRSVGWQLDLVFEAHVQSPTNRRGNRYSIARPVGVGNLNVVA